MTTVLTDAEIMCVYLTSPSDILTGLRAVEAATLARGCCLCGGDVAKHNTYLSAVRRQRDERVPEREARRRERAAWRKGFLKAWEDARACVREKAMFGSMLWDKDRQVPIMDAEFFNEEPEFIYPDVPLPATARARTVTLSDGTTLRCTETGSLRQVFEVCVVGKSPQYWSDGGDPLIYKFAKTPADARLLADLVEHPVEKIPA